MNDTTATTTTPEPATLKHEVTTLRGYLEWTALSAQLPGWTNAFGMEKFVLEHGREFKGQTLPKFFRKGAKQACFMNAAKLVIKHGFLNYCEGYAIGCIIPVLHAWACDDEGNVIDNTWKDPEQCQYFGIVFRRHYLMRKLAESGYYGLLDDWDNGRDFPLLRGKVPMNEWKEELRA